MKKLLLRLGSLVFWMSWPVLWLYMRHGTRTRLLLVCEDEFLALRGWLSLGDFGMPGGGVHKNEAPVDGLLREVYEETGITLRPERLKHAYRATQNRAGMRFSYDLYVCQLPTKPAVHLQRKELAGYAWLPVSSAPHGLAPELSKALAWWKAKV